MSEKESEEKFVHRRNDILSEAQKKLLNFSLFSSGEKDKLVVQEEKRNLRHSMHQNVDTLSLFLNRK